MRERGQQSCLEDRDQKKLLEKAELGTSFFEAHNRISEEVILFKLCGMLQAFSLHAIVIQLSLSHFCMCKLGPIHIQEYNPNKLSWLTNLTLVIYLLWSLIRCLSRMNIGYKQLFMYSVDYCHTTDSNFNCSAFVSLF